VRVGSVLVWAKQPSTAFWYGPFWAEDVGQGGDCQARRTAASSTGRILIPPPIKGRARGRPSESCGGHHPARTRRVALAQSRTVPTV